MEKNPPKNAEDVIAIAPRVGVELTAEDLEFPKEMSLEDAKQVAGGMSKDQVKHGCESSFPARGCGNGMYATCVVVFGQAHWQA